MTRLGVHLDHPIAVTAAMPSLTTQALLAQHRLPLLSGTRDITAASLGQRNQLWATPIQAPLRRERLGRTHRFASLGECIAHASGANANKNLHEF